MLCLAKFDSDILIFFLLFNLIFNLEMPISIVYIGFFGFLKNEINVVVESIFICV